jgi:hypothetical protein
MMIFSLLLPPFQRAPPDSNHARTRNRYQKVDFKLTYSFLSVKNGNKGLARWFRD